MARFTFEIQSDDEHEISGLMVRLFGHEGSTTVRPKPVAAAPANDEPAPDEVKRRARRTKAEMEADKEIVAEDTKNDPVEPEPEEVIEDVTLDMVKAVGSKAMSVIKASGVAAVFKSHGGGAESFGTLDERYYPAVYEALQASL